MKTNPKLLILCIFLLAAPLQAASSFSANELKGLLGAKGQALRPESMHIKVVGLFCLSPDTEAEAQKMQRKYRPGFPYLWWEGGDNHQGYRIPRLRRRKQNLKTTVAKHVAEVKQHRTS